ncbi:hypothetical protein [Fimbriiglobus ruber]|uniref:Uncharacterized protein n=1 Tax=Fimbriiglobus ruber TaxID=1908690 RepID=A0A225DCW7_9BACT|nr:hypothetical protein [Fimbriiglobus ruber]OWK37474.1 hypothetical protein FRUB_06594 [Fimbriiglobus ruber]
MTQQTPPRLNTDVGIQSGYAPISWTAVAALAVVIVYLFALAIMGLFAFRDGKPLIEVGLLIPPALVVVLAFVARRQIRVSEGTRTGETYANVAWWIAIVCGLGYVTYLGAIEFLIRNQAEATFTKWATFLKDADPSNPNDPNLFESCWWTLSPGTRVNSNPRDLPGFEKSHQAELAAYRQVDVVRICSRNRGAVEFKTHGLQDWQQKPTEISCVLAATLVTPEGDFELMVPLRASVDDKKVRRWQIAPSMDGYVKHKKLTRYGWMVEYLDVSGRQAARDFMSRVGSPDTAQAAIAYLAFVRPEWTARHATEVVNEIVKSTDARSAVVGSTGAVVFPYPPQMREHLSEKVFAKPNGAALSSNDLDTFFRCWHRPNRIVPSGSVIRGNTDVNPVLIADGKTVELRNPCELVTSSDNATPAAARGRLILRPIPFGDPFLSEFLAAREAGLTAPRTEKPPADMTDFGLNWKVVKIESDLATYDPKPPGPPPGGPGGGMPGMMGS